MLLHPSVPQHNHHARSHQTSIVKWIIQFLIGESRLLELWDQAADNPVVQLFDPGHRSKVAKFVYHWLSFVLPIGCLLTPFAFAFLDGFGRLSSFLGGTFGFLVACCFIGAISLPVFGMIVLRGRLHEREGLEQLCLTPLGRDEIAFGAVYWPIKFCFRALPILVVLTWLTGLLWLFVETSNSRRFDLEEVFDMIAGVVFMGSGATLVLVSFALASLMVSTRAALSQHTGRWQLLYRVPFEMIPHVLWLFGVILGASLVGYVVGDIVLHRAEDFFELVFGGGAALLLGVGLIKFQLNHLVRHLCFDGPSIFFEEIREPDEPQPIWGKAEWSIFRSGAQRKRVFAELRTADHYAARSEWIGSLAAAAGFLSFAVVCIHNFEAAFPFNRFRRQEVDELLIDRLGWMLSGPGVTFIFPTVCWLAWWKLFGGKRSPPGEAIRRDAPLLSAIYGLWRTTPAWAVPAILVAFGLVTSVNHLSGGIETFFSSTAWLMYVVFGFIVACVVSLQVQVSPNPQRAANIWLGISFVFVMAAGYRDEDHFGRIWRMNEDVIFTALAGVFLCGTAVVYILPVAGHIARHRGLDAPNDDEE